MKLSNYFESSDFVFEKIISINKLKDIVDQSLKECLIR